MSRLVQSMSTHGIASGDSTPPSQTVCSEVLNSLYGFVRARQLEGTYPGDKSTGTWSITPLRVLCGWGAVTEDEWPSPSDWPPNEPPELDAKAKARRLHHYQRVRSVGECCVVLGHLRPVQVTLEILGNEELFVRPRFRRRGIATRLAERLIGLSAACRRPLRMWIPFADWTESNIASIDKVIARLGLSLFHSKARWAVAMAVDPNNLPPNPRTQEDRK